MTRGVETDPAVEMRVLATVILASSDGLPKPFTPIEERMWFERLRSGDPEVQAEAREKIVLHNLRLVRKVLHACIRKEHWDECYGSGILGLLTAIERFDLERGNKFSTYAMLWIRQGIVREHKKEHFRGLYRIPHHQSTQLRKLTAHMYRYGLGEDELDIALVREVLGCSVESAQALINLVKTIGVSIDEPISSHSTLVYGDILASLPMEPECNALSDALHQAIADLPELQRQVIELYFLEQQTLEKIALELKEPLSQVRLCLRIALGRLKVMLEL